MTRAFVDTTILADILLKVGAESLAARTAIVRYDHTNMPVYALKELQYGPLRAFRYFHNKLVSTKSAVATFKAIQQLSRTPQRNLLSTALEALVTSKSMVSKKISPEFIASYEAGKSRDEIEADELRLATFQVISLAWRRRRRITKEVSLALPCYQERAPSLTRGMLDGSEVLCRVEHECCYAKVLRERRADLVALKAAIEAQPYKAENDRRLKAIKELLKRKGGELTEQMCRSLGDAYFALFCPPDHTILTTNDADHRPLALALGKTVERP